MTNTTSQRIVVHDCAGHPFPAQLSRELARRGHVVEHQYCASFESGHGALAATADDPAGFSIRPVALWGEFSKYQPIVRVLQELEYAMRAWRAIRSHRPDIAVLCNMPLVTCYVLALLLRLVRQDYAFWHQDVHSVAIAEMAVRRSRRLGAIVGGTAQIMERSVARGATVVIAITDAFREVYDGWRVSPRNVAVIPNWAPIDELPLVPRSREWLGDEGELRRFLVVYSGTLGLKHNPRLLLELAKSPSLDDCSIVIVSNGRGRQWLDQHAHEAQPGRLILRDYVPYEDLPRVLGAGDVLVAILEPGASRYSVPSKVLTYMCAGRPIVAAISDDNAAARTIVEEQLGYVVNGDEPEELGTTLRKVLDQPDDASAMGERSRAVAERDFTITSIGDRFETALRLTAIP